MSWSVGGFVCLLCCRMFQWLHKVCASREQLRCQPNSIARHPASPSPRDRRKTVSHPCNYKVWIAKTVLNPRSPIEPSGPSGGSGR